MTIGFVLGNGRSRAPIPLNFLKTKGIVYGCNALYRHFTPDVLVATDLPMATEIQESGYSASHPFYTRKPVPGSGARLVPAKYYGFSSGPIAAALAVQDCDVIFLIGFDFGTKGASAPRPAPPKNLQLTKKQKQKERRAANSTGGLHFNNMYADSKHYKKSSDGPTYGGNWIKQITTIAESNPAVHFIRVVGKCSAAAEFAHLPNVTSLDIDSFLKMLNTL